MKRYYATLKRCNEYISKIKPSFESKEAFEKAIEDALIDFKVYDKPCGLINCPNQQRFFTKVLKISKETK